MSIATNSITVILTIFVSLAIVCVRSSGTSANTWSSRLLLPAPSDSCYSSSSLSTILRLSLASMSNWTRPTTFPEETVSVLPKLPTLFNVTVKCDAEDAIWQYRFRNDRKTKGPRRLRGKGRVSFTKSSNTNFDFGLKSGQCLIFNKEYAAKLGMDVSQISSLEGFFNEKGELEGSVEIGFFDKSLIKATMVRSSIIGTLLYFEAIETDDAGQLDQDAKRLSQVSCCSNENALKTGFLWRLMENGNLVFENDNNDNLSVVIPFDAEDDDLLVGKPDQDDQDIILDVRKAKLENFHNDICNLPKIVYKEYELIGEDFDLTNNIFIDAKVARVRRVLEKLADSKEQLWTHDNDYNDNDGNDYQDDHEEFVYSLRILKCVNEEWKRFRIQTLDGEVDARLEGSVQSNQGGSEVSGRGVFHVLSDIRRNTNNDTNEDKENNFHDYYTLSQLSSLHMERRVATIATFFEQGKAEGRTKIVFTDNTVLEGPSKGGRLDGIVRWLDRPLRSSNEHRVRYSSELSSKPTTWSSSMTSAKVTKDEPVQEVSSVAVYRKGSLVGPVYSFLVGGSILYASRCEGRSESKLSSSSAAFIMPDLKHAVMGEVIEGQMQSGHLVIVKGLQKKSFMDEIHFEDAITPTEKVLKVDLDDPNSDLLSEDLMEKLVYVKQSSVAGEGLFAKQIIESHTPVAFFGGHRLTLEQYNELVQNVIYPQYSMRFRLRAKDPDQIVYLPDDLGKDLEKYRATLGHKINVDLIHFNCLFVPAFHPRFGLELPMAVTTRRVSVDEELLCYYEQPFDLADPWYQELWRSQIDHDWIDGPFGFRAKNRSSETKMPIMLTDPHLAKEFHHHAINVLKLKPFT